MYLCGGVNGGIKVASFQPVLTVGTMTIRKENPLRLLTFPELLF